MRATGVLIAAGFRRYTSYRLATFAGAFTNSVFGLLRASITMATIAAAGGTLGGYTVVAGITYAWVTQALIAPVYLGHWMELAIRVRAGDIAVDLARPIDLQLQLWAADLGRAAAIVLPRAAPPLLVGALTFGLALPGDPWAYLAGAVSVLLAISISFACRFAVNLLAFWTLDIRGILTLYVMTCNLLCGLAVPVHWFPGWLGAVARCTPFPSILQLPTDILTGRTTGTDVLGALGVQAMWLVITLALGRLLLSRATRRLVIQGG